MLFLALVLVNGLDVRMRDRNVRVGAEEVVIWEGGDGRGS